MRVRDFEAPLLQVVAEIEFRSAHEEGALGIDNDANLIGLDHDIAIGGAIDEIHFVLKARASAADDGNTKCTLRAALFFKKISQARAGGIAHAN